MTGVQLPGPNDGNEETLEAHVTKVEAISLRLGSWLADPAEEPAPELAGQLRSLQAIEQLVAEQLSDGVSSHLYTVLETAFRAVILVMTQRQKHHGRLSKVASEEIKQCSLLVTACGDRILKGLVAAPWAEGTSVQMSGESGRAIGLLVHTLVRLVAIGCEPSLWAPLQNTAWAKLNALREAGALGLGNPRGRELRQLIGAEVIKRLGDRQRTISELAASSGGQINASADGIDRQAKVLRFFAAKGAGLVPSDPIELVETLCGIVAEMLFVVWHQPKVDEGPSNLSMAVNALLEMLVSLGAELPADTHGVGVLSSLASWFTGASSERVQTLGVLLCLVRLLPLTSNWPAAQQVAAAQPLMQLARTAMQHLCKLAQVKHTDAFGAVFEDSCQSLAKWVVSVPLSIQSQLQLFLLEMVLAPGNSAACPEMAVVAVTVWDTALRNMEDARILHAHAQTLINLVAGVGALLPSTQATIRGLLCTICGRLSAEVGKAADDQTAAALVGGSVNTFQNLLGSLAETIRGAESGAGLELVLPALLQPPSTRALRLLQDAAAQSPAQNQHGQQAKHLVHLGKALSAAAISVSADAAAFSGAQGQGDLNVLLNALEVLVQYSETSALTPNALAGAAALLRIATRLELASRSPEGQRPLEQAAGARRLRDACCDVLRASMGPPAAAASVPLLTRLLVLEALVDGVTALDSAAAAKSSPVLPLFKQCLASVQAAVMAAEDSSTVPRNVTTARGWRERSVLNEASQRTLRKCRLQQVEKVIPNSVAAYAFEYSTKASMLGGVGNTEILQDIVMISGSGQHQQADGGCELNSLQVDAATDNCWERARKRVRTSAGTCAVAKTAAFSGADEQVLCLREMIENWTEAGVVKGLAMMLSQVKQLLVAVEVHGVHELQRQLQQLEQQLGDQNKEDDEESSGRNAQQIEGGASVW